MPSVLWVCTQLPFCCCILHGAGYWNSVGCGSGCSFTRNCTAVPWESSDNRLKCCVPGVIFLNLKNFPSVKACLPHHAVSEQCQWPLSRSALSFCAAFVYRGTGRRLGNAVAVLQEMQADFPMSGSVQQPKLGGSRECGCLGAPEPGLCWLSHCCPLPTAHSSKLHFDVAPGKTHARALCLSPDKAPQNSSTVLVTLFVCVISGDSALTE